MMLSEQSLSQYLTCLWVKRRPACDILNCDLIHQMFGLVLEDKACPKLWAAPQDCARGVAMEDAAMWAGLALEAGPLSPQSAPCGSLNISEIHKNLSN